jgi:hypothetical protein
MDEQGAKQRRKPFLSLGAALAILAGAVAIVAPWWRRRPGERPSVLPEVPPGLAALQIASVGFPYILAQGMAIAVITVTIPSAAQKYLKLDWLQQPADYGFIGLAVLVWALI